MSQFTTIAEVWSAIDKGQTVHWSSDAYALTVEPKPERFANHPYFAGRGDKVLRVTCTENYFGSVLEASELGNLYTKGGDK